MFVGDIVHSQADAVARSSGGAVEVHRENLAVSGRPVEYSGRHMGLDEAWSMLPQSTSQWATEQAGPPINDPVTGTPRQYWWCNVKPSAVGPGGENTAVSGGDYELVMFARRGLVIARGTTDRFVAEPGATRWKTTRWVVPVDGSAVRNGHRHGAAPHLTPSPTDSAKSSSGGTGQTPSKVQSLLGTSLRASQFGNLPADTQRFLLDPFFRSDTQPQDVNLHALRTTRGGQETEEFWTYLFNKRWMGFCYARRSIPEGRGRAPLDTAPWNLAAWTAPVQQPGQAVAPTST